MENHISWRACGGFNQGLDSVPEVQTWNVHSQLSKCWWGRKTVKQRSRQTGPLAEAAFRTLTQRQHNTTSCRLTLEVNKQLWTSGRQEAPRRLPSFLLGWRCTCTSSSRWSPTSDDTDSFIFEGIHGAVLSCSSGKHWSCFFFGQIQCDVTTRLIPASWSHFILMASQKCFLRPACVFIPASEEEGGVFFCCSKLMLHNHRQQVIPSDRPNAWRRINQPRESIQNYNLRHRFPIRTGWMCLDEIIGKTQNNIHWIQNVPPLIYRNSREYMSWGPVRRFTSYWEPQTLRDFSKTRHTLSHKVQFIFSVKHRTQNAAKNSSRRTHGGQSWAQHLRNEKFPRLKFSTRSATVTEYRSSRKT